jgi:uncharacterized protein YbjQ (UPF0145 family)
MPFWRKDTEEERQRKEFAAQQAHDQQQSIRELELGGLPVQATRRLTEQASSPSKLFSSTLTAKEYLLAREAGYQPIGQVMGTSFMRVAYGFFNTGLYWNVSSEMESLTYAHKRGWELAVSRLKQEAQLLGADGVIGVRVKKTNATWSSGITEFTAIGTAIKLPDRDMLTRITNLPFTSSLSGQEFWQLFEGGYWPCGLVMGNCSYFVYGDWQTCNSSFGFFASLSNQELTQFTQGLNTARAMAMNRLRQNIAIEGGDGAVDMDVDYHLHHHHYEKSNQTQVNMVIEFMASGTAVICRPDGKARIAHQPLFIMDLSGRSKRELEFDVSMQALTGAGVAEGDALE